MNNVMVLARLADTAITDPIGDWDNGFNEGVEKALEVAVECFAKTDGDDQLKRIADAQERTADALERAYPPHGWLYCTCKGTLSRDRMAAEGFSTWHMEGSPYKMDDMFFHMRRPAPAPVWEEPSDDGSDADPEECPACANGNAKLGPEHAEHCPKHCPF